MASIPKNMNNQEIVFTTNTEAILDGGRPISQKLTSLENNIDYIKTTISDNVIRTDNVNLFNKNSEYKKHTIVRDSYNGVYISRKNIEKDSDTETYEDYNSWLNLSLGNENKVIMKSTWNSGMIKYNTDGMFTPDEISTMLETDTYYGYINNGDIVELDTQYWRFTFVVNINTYFNFDTSKGNKPNNIDLICVRVDSKINSTEPVPWMKANFINTNIVSNPKIPQGDALMILTRYVDDSWHNYVPALLINHKQGFGYEFANHIVPKLHGVLKKAYNKKMQHLGRLEYGIEPMSNLDKVWFLYITEICGDSGFVSDYERCACDMYPMFKKVHYRKFNFNGQYVASITSSVVANEVLKPVYLDKYSYQTVNIGGDTQHPLFGMRFV